LFRQVSRVLSRHKRKRLICSKLRKRKSMFWSATAVKSATATRSKSRRGRRGGRFYAQRGRMAVAEIYKVIIVIFVANLGIMQIADSIEEIQM
jgi:hypothetical protein